MAYDHLQKITTPLNQFQAAVQMWRKRSLGASQFLHFQSGKQRLIAKKPRHSKGLQHRFLLNFSLGLSSDPLS
jgi:hypothetical protein